MDCSAVELQSGRCREAELAVCVRTSVSVVDVGIQMFIVVCLRTKLLTAVYRVQSAKYTLVRGFLLQ